VCEKSFGLGYVIMQAYDPFNLHFVLSCVDYVNQIGVSIEKGSILPLRVNISQNIKDMFCQVFIDFIMSWYRLGYFGNGVGIPIMFSPMAD